jgi:hypothetical protein
VRPDRRVRAAECALHDLIRRLRLCVAFRTALKW